MRCLAACEQHEAGWHLTSRAACASVGVYASDEDRDPIAVHPQAHLGVSIRICHKGQMRRLGNPVNVTQTTGWYAKTRQRLTRLVLVYAARALPGCVVRCSWRTGVATLSPAHGQRVIEAAEGTCPPLRSPIIANMTAKRKAIIQLFLRFWFVIPDLVRLFEKIAQMILVRSRYPSSCRAPGIVAHCRFCAADCHWDRPNISQHGCLWVPCLFPQL